MQDFSKKMTIVVREDIVSWQFTNTIGHIAAYLGNKISEPFDTGEYFVSSDDVKLPRNSQYPVVVLKATKEEIMNLSAKARNSGLTWITYVQEMIDMTDDEELASVLRMKRFEDMNILGVGIFGTKEKLKVLTGGLPLWK